MRFDWKVRRAIFPAFRANTPQTSTASSFILFYTFIYMIDDRFTSLPEITFKSYHALFLDSTTIASRIEDLIDLYRACAIDGQAQRAPCASQYLKR